MSTLVECVPNFSEGRDKAQVDAIIDAMKMNEVYLLDRESDFDIACAIAARVNRKIPTGAHRVASPRVASHCQHLQERAFQQKDRR